MIFLNSVITLILLFFTEFDSFAGLYDVTVVEDWPILSVELSSSTFGQNCPTLQLGLSGIAEPLVNIDNINYL